MKIKIFALVISIILTFGLFYVVSATQLNAYVITNRHGEITIIWDGEDRPYAWFYYGLVDIDTGQGLIQVEVPYVGAVDGVFYYRKNICLSGTIINARLVSTLPYPPKDDVYLLGTTLDGLCRQEYLPLVRNGR